MSANNIELPIERNADYELIDTWQSEPLGRVEVYLNRKRNQYVLHKKFELSARFGASPAEMLGLEQRIRELPEEVTLASASYSKYDHSQPLFSSDDQDNSLFLDYSSQNLRKEVLKRKQAGQKMSESESLGCFGFLLGLGSFMEQGLEFHRSVCLKNLLIIDGQLQLTNPYISDSHVGLVLRDFIRPAQALENIWTPEMVVDDRLRAEVGKQNVQVRQLNELHRAYVRQMHVDSCLAFLAVATTQDDGIFLNSNGDPNKTAISTALKVKAYLHKGNRWKI